MIRKKKPKTKFKVDLIITADWHLFEKERNPPCRTDNIWDAQWDKVNQINELQEKYKCEIFNAGDIFEHWKTSPQLLNECFSFPKNMVSIAGNHDMPQHNIELLDKSGLETLFRSKIIDFGFGHTSWNDDLNIGKTGTNIQGKNVLMAHIMTWKGKKPWPDCTDPECHELFDMFPKADLIITGHNHKTFIAKKGDRLLINPGSLTRHKSDQINHKPCVFLWNAETNTCKVHYLKVKKDVISRDHIEIKKNKDKREQAFINKLVQGWDLSLSFEENLERAFKENETPNKIKELIYKWMNV